MKALVNDGFIKRLSNLNALSFPSWDDFINVCLLFFFRSPLTSLFHLE